MCIDARMKRLERYKLKPLQLMLLRLRVSVALLSTTVAPALSMQGTPEQRMACTPDVFRLCSAFIPNADEITICLREKYAELSDVCRIVFEAGMQQPPDVSDGTVTRNRTAR
jgi:hypothetical protein